MHTFIAKGEIIHEWEPCSPADIDATEREMRVKFPHDYRRFLLEHNGLMFPNDLLFPIVDGDQQPRWGELSRLFGVSRPGSDARDIVDEQNAYDLPRRLPANLVAIGEGHVHRICMSVEGKDRGSVYYWSPPDYWEDSEPGPSYADLMLAARSFSDFWDRLRIPDERDEPDIQEVPRDLRE